MSIIKKQGDTWVLSCQYTDENGDAASLAGVTILSQVRDEQSVLLLEFETTVILASAGTFTLTAPAADTVDLNSGKHLFDIQFTDTAGAVHSTVTEKFVILADNTKAVA